MNWDATAAVAELLGALGVIASLVYLAGQVKSSGYQARQAAVQSVVNKMNDVWNTMAAASTADLWTRGSRGLANLDGESEGVQFSALMLSIFRPYEELFHYRTHGQVDDWTWESVSSVCHDLMGTRGVQDWWEHRSRWFSAAFRAHIAEVGEGLPAYHRFKQQDDAAAS